MTLSANRQRFEKISISIGRAFSHIPLSPNQWTLFTLVPTVIALWFLIENNFLAAAVFFILAGFLDMVDGAVARVMGKVSRIGAYLDTIIDRYVEGIIVLGLVLAGLPDFYLEAEVWIVLYLFGGMMTTYAKAAAKEKNLVISELKGGLLERPERLLLLFLGIILAAHTPLFLTAVVAFLAIFANLSAIQRVIKAVRIK